MVRISIASYCTGRIALRKGSSSGSQMEWRRICWISMVTSPVVKERAWPPALVSSETKWKWWPT